MLGWFGRLEVAFKFDLEVLDIIPHGCYLFDPDDKCYGVGGSLVRVRFSPIAIL